MAPTKYEIREPYPGYPHFAEAITSKDDVQYGDHILFQVTELPFRPKFRSALVVDTQEHIEIIMNSEEGVVRRLIPFHMMKKLHKIVYMSQLYSEAKSVERAERRLKHSEKCYHVLKNNSHFFVTWCITGREYSLTDILRVLEDSHLVCKEEHLKPIFYKIPITNLNLYPGDHVMDGSQHYLIESVNKLNGTFSAYTLCENAQVILRNKVSLSPSMVRVECDLYKSKVAQVLKIAEDKLASQWKSPEFFITAMKCGIEYSFDENHCFVLERNIETSFKLLTPDLGIKAGDHLMIRDYRNPISSHSVLVYNCPDHTSVRVKPQVDANDVIDLTLYPEVYRVDYSDELPTSEILIRGESKRGDAVLRKYPSDHSYFVMWAKAGLTKCVSIPVDIKHNILCYEKVASSDQIQVGDHLLQHVNNPSNQRHSMVTEHISDSKFKVIVFQQGNLQEQVEELQGEFYVIKYQSDLLLSPKDAIKRARDQIGPRFNPWDRMLFIVQAKLKNSSQETSIPVSVNEKSVLMTKQQPLSSTFSPLPMSKSRIMCFKQVTLGDYIIMVPNNSLSLRNSQRNHHYLVVSSDNSPTQCTVIESCSGKIVKLQCTIEPSTDSASKQPFFYYRIDYEPGVCISPSDSIKKANEMIGERTKIDNDKFVQYMKVGDQVEVRVAKLPDERDHIQQLKLSSADCIPFLGQPLYSLPITSCDHIFVGTHIIYKHGNAFPPLYRSALVIDIQRSWSCPSEKILDLITNTLCNGFTKQSVKYSQLQCVSKVVYLSSKFSEEEAVMRAKYHLQYHENFYHPEFYNSHHFVTMCKTGQEHSLTDILMRKQVEDYEEMKQKSNQDLKLKPVLFKVPVKDLANVNPADHIMINGQHYLIKSKYVENGTFSAYTVIESSLPLVKSPVSLVTREWKKTLNESIMACKIDYSLQQGRYCEPLQTLERAEEERIVGSKWKSSEGFVSKIKCDTECFFDDRCLINDNVHIVSCTLVTPNISINEGDHLVLLNEKEQTKFRSVLVCKSTDTEIVDIMPPLNLSESDIKPSISIAIKNETIDLTNYLAYRINYSQSLPSEDVLQRARSDSARCILVKYNLNADCFVSWAKTGKELPIIDSVLSELLKKPKIAEIRPVRYEKIMSPDEIQVGDHLFTKNILDIVDYELQRSHFIIVERLAHTVNPVFSVIQFSKGILIEAEREFNPRIEDGSSQVYRIAYPEEFPGELAVKRVRSLLKKRFLTTCASSLMRWAKTGSEEGLEIDFLINSCAPTSKSQIACFTQLNPGDYLIKNARAFDHHYLVVSIESPTECTVIESWKRKVEEKSLTCNNWPDESTYYRVNYDPGQCIPAEHSIEIARNACSNVSFFSRYWKPNSECARESFVHFVKTGERSVNTEHLSDDRLFLQRELIKSALDLQVGDHIERPLALAPEHAQHHMLVVEPIDHTTCKVIHYRVEKSMARVLKFKKGDVVSEAVNIFGFGDVFRIVYPERTDPRNGMEKLSGICEEGKTRLQTELGKIEYHIKDNNCEHLIMLATIGIPLSIQVNQVIRHALICARGSFRAFRGSVIHQGAECAPKEATAHYVGQACASSSMKEATRGVVKSGAKPACQASALAMAGGIALAINLAVETPIYVRSIYKLKKKAKFEVISEEEYKRSIIKETLVSFSVVAGGTAGTVAGQATIPVPILGAMVGGLLGGLVGQGTGYIAGEITGRLIKEKKLTLPKTLSYKYKVPLED